MNDNAQQRLLAHLGVLLAPLRIAAESEFVLRDMAASVGWDLDEITGIPVEGVRERVKDFVDAYTTLSAFIQSPPQTLSELRTALDAADRACQSIRDLSAILAEGTQPSQFKEFGKDLVAAMTIAHLQTHMPVLYHLAVLFTVIEPADNKRLSDPIFDSNDKLVRVPHTRPKLRLERIVELITSPEDVLKREYIGPDGLTTAVDAQRTADKLFPRLAALLAVLGANVSYGFKAAYNIDLADPDRVTAGVLAFWSDLEEVEGEFGAMLSLSPAERGNLGLVVSPFGSTEFTHSFGEWTFDLRLSAGIDAFALGPQGLRLLLGMGGTGDHVSVRVELSKRLESAETVTRFGSTTGTRLEAKSIRMLGEADLRPADQNYGFLAEAKEAAFFIVPGDGDGFLQAILPTDGLRMDFDFAVGWSNKRGLYFRGGAGLEIQLPLSVSLGPVSVDSLSLALKAEGEDTRTEIATAIRIQLGPVSAVVEGVGLGAMLSFSNDGGNLGVADLALGFKPPTGIGLAIAGPGVTGGGFLFFDPAKAEYGGIVQLELGERIAVKAIGLLTTRMPDGAKGYSLLLLITAEGFTPIPLGFGFTLTGIGGLLGIHRTVRTDTVRQGLKTGTLDSILFPRDPVRNAPQLVSDLRSVFPPASGRHVLGPMVQLRWGTPTLLTLDLAVLLELPTPVRLIVLGRLQVLLPNQSHPLVQVRMDALGVLDFTAGTVALDATLYDSRILEFTLTGDMALRAGWGRQPNFVLAIGGLHPRFPAPAGLPVLKRLMLTLADGDSLQLRCQAYLAVTSNTVQFGARVDLHAAGGGFSFDGMLGFDALIQLTPLAFEVDVAAALALRYHGHLLMGISFTGRLAGPTPWHVEGKATIKILFFKVSVHFERQFGSRTAPPLPEAVDALALVTEALRDRRNWSATLPVGEPAVVTLRETMPAPETLRVHPWAELTVRERVVPLNRPIIKVGTAPLRGGPTTVTVRATDRSATPQPVPTTLVKEPFALAQFEELRDDELLARPAFETQDAGLSFTADTVACEEDLMLTTVLRYETQLIDPTRPPEPARPGYTLPATVLARVAVFGAAGQSALRRTGRHRYRSPELVA